jgi:integrase
MRHFARIKKQEPHRVSAGWVLILCSMRHRYRSWLDAVGTGIAVQQKLMRNSDIRTTMNVYGRVLTDEMNTAASKVAGLALNGLRTDCAPS